MKINTNSWPHSSFDYQTFELHVELFNPRELGDSMIIVKATTLEIKNWQTIYCSLDSTEAYIRDVYD